MYVYIIRNKIVCVCVRVRACACVRACARARARVRTCKKNKVQKKWTKKMKCIVTYK